MVWHTPADGQQKPNLFEEARARDKSEVTIFLHNEEPNGTQMDSFNAKAIHLPGRWLGKFAARKVAQRLSGDALPEVADGEEVVTVYAPLTSELGNVLQQGQKLVADAVRVRKSDGTFEMRKIAPVTIGVVAALSIGAAVVIRRHRR